MYLAATDVLLICGELPEEAKDSFSLSLIQLLGAIGAIASVMLFAKTLHDPKSPRDAEQLKRRDDIEKGGAQYEYFPSVAQNNKSASDNKDDRYTI